MVAEAASAVAAPTPPVSRAWEPARLVMLLWKVQNENRFTPPLMSDAFRSIGYNFSILSRQSSNV